MSFWTSQKKRFTTNIPVSTTRAPKRPLDAHTPCTKWGYFLRAMTAMVPPYPTPQTITLGSKASRSRITVPIRVATSAKAWSAVKNAKSSKEAVLYANNAIVWFWNEFHIKVKVLTVLECYFRNNGEMQWLEHRQYCERYRIRDHPGSTHRCKWQHRPHIQKLVHC